jgi:hypothetical protein
MAGASMGGLPVPLKSLAQPDDKEALQTPMQGDSVTMQVEATIDRIEGDMAYITPTSVNGNPLGEEALENPNAADELEGSELQGMAQSMS